MLSRNDFFDFEDKTYDFPFYNKNTGNFQRNTKILLLNTLLFIFLIFGPIKLPNGQEQVLLFIFTLIMLLLFTKGNIGTFFRMPEKKDLRLIIICYILYEVWYIAMVSFINLIKYPTATPNAIDINNFILLTNMLQVIAEEIFRAFLFLMILRFTYNKGFNRKKAITISIIITLVIFGLLHYNNYPSILQILLIQGFGGFAIMYPYIKTKNLTLSVIVHILINLASWSIILRFW